MGGVGFVLSTPSHGSMCFIHFARAKQFEDFLLKSRFYLLIFGSNFLFSNQFALGLHKSTNFGTEKLYGIVKSNHTSNLSRDRESE